MKKQAKRKLAASGSQKRRSRTTSAPKRSRSAPQIKKEPGWEEVELPFNIGSGRTIYAGLEKDARLRLRVFRSSSSGELVGRVWFGPGSDGPPRHAHGGAVAYVLDEAMGAVAWMNGFPALAAKLEFEYLHRSPLEVDLHVSARIVNVSARRLKIESQLRLPTGEICVTGRGEFARVSRGKVKEFGLAAHDPKGLLRMTNLKWADDHAG